MSSITILKSGTYLQALGGASSVASQVIEPLFRGVYGHVSDDGKFVVDTELAHASYFFSLIARGVDLPLEALETIETDAEVNKSLRASLTAVLKWNWAKAYDQVPTQNAMVSAALANERQIALGAADGLITNLGVQLYAVGAVLENAIVRVENASEGEYLGSSNGGISIDPVAESRLMEADESTAGSGFLTSDKFEPFANLDPDETDDEAMHVYGKLKAEIIVPATNPQAAIALANLINTNPTLGNLILNGNNGIVRPLEVLALSHNPIPRQAVGQTMTVLPADVENQVAQLTAIAESVVGELVDTQAQPETEPEVVDPAPVQRDRSMSGGFFSG